LALVILVAAASVALRGMARAEPDRTAEPLPVVTTTVKRVESHQRDVWFTGRLRAARESALGFERRAKLMDVRVDDGDRVDAGQVLATLDTSSLRRRREELVARRESTRAKLELAELTEKRQKRLLDQGHTSEQRYDEANLDARSLAAQVEELSASIASIDLDIAKSRLQAPFAGRVQTRHMDEGTIVAPGEPVVTLVETAAMEARIGVPPGQADTLAIGRRYPLRVNGRTVDGELTGLSPDLTPSTRTVTAVFDLAAGAGTAAIGEVVRLRRQRAVPGRGYWLPLSALSEDIRGLWSVLTLHETPDGTAGYTLKRETVEVVEIDGDRVFATGSVDDGRRIVADGVNRVVPGQRVVPAESQSVTDQTAQR
jgi:RND family efflux transporter MFP subunit